MMDNKKALEEEWKKAKNIASLNSTDFKEAIVSFGKKMTYKKDAILISRGEFPNFIYFIVKGNVLGVKDFEDGTAYNYFRLNSKNGSLGLLEILAQKTVYVATIIALDEVEVIKVPSHIIYQEIMNNPLLLKKSLYLLSNDLYVRSKEDGIFLHLTSKERMESYLIERFKEKEAGYQYLELKEKKEDLSNQLGLSLRTLSRVLKSLKEEKKIQIYRGKIWINNEQVKQMKKELESKK